MTGKRVGPKVLLACLRLLYLTAAAGCAEATPTRELLPPPPTVAEATATATSVSVTEPEDAVPLPTPVPTLRAVSHEFVAERLGVDVGGVGDRGLEFTDVALTLRRWEILEADACPENSETCRYAPLDEAGWPTTDTRTVFFDVRPFGAWWSQDQADCPNCQDGDYQIDVSGTYKLAFTGQALLTAAEGGVDVRNQVYDAGTNTTTADIVVAPDQGLLFVRFVNTRRTPESELNSGVADVRLMRPGYDLDTDTVFTPDFLAALEPFSTLRFMNWVGGNNVNPPFDSEADSTLDWGERNLPTARQNLGEGVAWEYVIELANLTGKHIWINIPIHASDDYIGGLAHLLQDTLHSDAVIYIEHSNEVWNDGFLQALYNEAAAVAEVGSGEPKPGAAPLDAGGLPLKGVWAQRRHVRRLVEISGIFRGVFGEDAINTRVRVIHSWQSGQPLAYAEQLRWVSENYGPPSRYLYAVAGAGYFGLGDIYHTASVDDVLLRLEQSSASHAWTSRTALQQVADRYELKHAMYEGGPDTAGPLKSTRPTDLLLTVIDAHADLRMGDLVVYDLWNHWFAHPKVEGDIFIYFTLQSAYDRWGMWGLTQDIENLQTPKYQAVTDMVGLNPAPPRAPLGVSGKAVGEGRKDLTWHPAFGAQTYSVYRGEGDARMLIADGITTTVYSDPEAPSGAGIYLIVAVNENGVSRPSRAIVVSP